MRRSSPRLAGRSLAAHLRKRSPKVEPNIVALRPRTEFGVIQTTNTLKVRYASPPGEQPHDLDLSNWVDRGELGLAVAYYFADWGPGRSRATRRGHLGLIGYFLAFLRALEASGLSPITSVSQMSTEVVELYIVWLDGKMDFMPSAAQPLSKLTKSQRYNALKQMLSFWEGSKRYGGAFPTDIKRPRNPWPGAHHDIKSTAILDPFSRSRVRKAAIAEIETDLLTREATFAALEDGALELPDPTLTSVVPFKDLRVKLRLMLKLFGGRLPLREELEAYIGLCRSMKQPYGTVREVAERLHFSPRALVPYIVLLDLDTTFNAEGILTLSWQDVKDHQVFGSTRWQISVPKDRAKKGRGDDGPGYHRRSFPTNLKVIDTPVNLLKAIKRYSKLSLPLLPERYRDRVFVFYVARQNGLRSYESADGSASSDGAWRNALKEFIAENELPDFTLRTLRATGGDVVHELTGDMKAQQAIMGHAGLGMTIRHYRSGAAKERDEERLSEAMAWRERFTETNGRSDTRNGSLRPGKQRAATPGFGCVDPYNPPFERHPSGKLCGAFGGCAACPLASINPDDPHAYARVLQFERKLIEAGLFVDPVRYVQVWAPQLVKVQQYWLPRFTEKGRSGASLALPPFPDLE